MTIFSVTYFLNDPKSILQNQCDVAVDMESYLLSFSENINAVIFCTHGVVRSFIWHRRGGPFS